MTAALLDHATPARALVLAELHDVLDRLVPDLAGDPDHAVTEIDRALRRLQAAKLAVVARADRSRLALRSGLADTSAWLSRRTNSGPATAASDVHLASALNTPGDAPRPAAVAFAAGAVSVEHARVIVRATEQLPPSLDQRLLEQVERDLTEKAEHLTPDQLRRVARRALEVVEDDRAAVDAHEDTQIAAEEAAARSRTRLSLHDNADGTVSGHFTVPTAQGHLLRKILQTITAPRRGRLGAAEAQVGPREARTDWDHARGEAFCELIEHLPTDHLHPRTAATVVVTMSDASLRSALQAAHLDTQADLSSGEARRLACSAGIIPAVLGGGSLPLDLGRSSRLFTEAQRTALGLVHATCAADGCERPFSWCELHHRDPWSHGGKTDLDQAIPLCHFHHRRIHDATYRHRHGPEGVTFHRRT